MKHILLPEGCSERRLVFYLSMEEYVAANLDRIAGEGGEAFFMWQVAPTVIFGRNQVMEAEVNMPYCKEKGIQLYRRKSGGGCVYSDKGNIMLSFITPSTNVAATFERILERLAESLRKAGLNAERSGRNDILVDGKKVSGNAYFLQPRSSIVHGTMLFDTDFEELVKAITPSEEKIKSKGVASVRQHVTNVRPYFEKAGDWTYQLTNIEIYKNYLVGEFCSAGDGIIDSITLTAEDVREIEEIEKGYLDPAFLEGRNHSWSVSRKAKIEGVGEVIAELELESGNIARCHVAGDFFALKEGVDAYLNSRLAGCPDNKEDIVARLAGADISQFIAGLTTDDFTGILITKD